MAVSAYENLYHEELYILPSPTVVVINTEWNALSADEKNLLGKILASVKLSPASVHVITREVCDPAELEALNPSQIISFGARPADPGLALYVFQKVADTPVIYTDSLRELDDSRKKSLWLALRQAFGV